MLPLPEPYNDSSDVCDTSMHLFEGDAELCRTISKENIVTYTIPTTIEQKIAQAVEKVKSLKEEKELLETRVAALEQELRQKDADLARLAAEKEDVKGQIEGLLDELDNLVAGA